MNCQHCTEPLADGDHVVSAYHRECLFRLMNGSLAHVEGRCSCFVPGSEESDPVGASPREAARLALAEFLRRAV